MVGAWRAGTCEVSIKMSKQGSIQSVMDYLLRRLALAHLCR